MLNHKSNIENRKLPVLLLLCMLPLISSGGCAAYAQRAAEREAGEALRLIEDPHFADERRRAVNSLVDVPLGRREPYLQLYRDLAERDPDHTVRAVAVRALNRARDGSSTPLFVRALNDPAESVRLEAAKALVNLPDERAAASLAGIVGDPEEDHDVRIAAAEALRHYPRIDVARALVPLLTDARFGIAWQARRSLVRMTGQDHRYDPAAWLGYLTGPDRPFG